MKVLVGDLGGTRIKLGLIDDGKVITQSILDAQSNYGLLPRLPLISESWRCMCRDHEIPMENIDGISLSFPAIINTKTNQILSEHNKYADAIDFDISQWAKQEFNLPIVMENDAKVALLGEKGYGAGRGSDDIVIMMLGTGIGTASVIEGKLLRGAHYQAGCLGGHLSVNAMGKKCQCGNIGCAELEASTANLKDMVTKSSYYPQSSLANATKINYKTVFQAYRNGDKCAISVIEQSLRIWSVLAVSLIHAYDPSKLIIGGGVTAQADIIIPAIQSFVNEHACTPWGKVEVVLAELGDAIALLGCYSLFADQYK